MDIVRSSNNSLNEYATSRGVITSPYESLQKRLQLKPVRIFRVRMGKNFKENGGAKPDR
jgi:hypothetical protein